MTGPFLADVAYEVLPEMEEVGYHPASKLSASFTPNNGIRVGILDHEDAEFWAEFTFTPEQARTLGAALLRWANEDEKPILLGNPA